MATLYVNGTTGNDANDGSAELHIIALVGPKATLEAAITAAAAYDTIRIASGIYIAPNTTGYVINKPLRIIGDRPGTNSGAAGGVRLRRLDVDSGPIIDIQPPSGWSMDGLTLRDLRLERQSIGGTNIDGDYGIKCSLAAVASTKLVHPLFENITVVGTRDSAVYLKGDTAFDTFIIFPQFRNCIFQDTRGHGVHFDDGGITTNGPAVVGEFYSCYFLRNHKTGMWINGTTFAMVNSYFESNCRSASMDATFDAQLRMNGCSPTLIGVYFENFTTSNQPTSKRAIVSGNSISFTLWGGGFANGSEDGDATQRCIYLYGGGGPDVAHHAVIGPVRVSNTKTFVEVEAANTRVEVYEPFKQAGTVLDSILPAGINRRYWT